MHLADLLYTHAVSCLQPNNQDCNHILRMFHHRKSLLAYNPYTNNIACFLTLDVLYAIYQELR